jgi:hypothetical protein
VPRDEAKVKSGKPTLDAISQTIFRKRAPAVQSAAPPVVKAATKAAASSAVSNEDEDVGDEFIDGIDDEFDDVAIDDELGDDFDVNAAVDAPVEQPPPEDDDYRVLKRSSVPHYDDLEDEDDGDVVITDERGRRRRAPHPATTIVREFETQVTEKGTSFLKVLGTLQKLSIHDRPRSMEHVIRIAEKLPSITPRQRMRMRYTLIAQHIMHYRYTKAFTLMQAVEDLTAIDASLSAVIVLLLTRRTNEANELAIQMDHLMRAGHCSFSSHALNALLVIYTAKGDMAEATYTHERLVGDDLPIDYDAMGGYLRMLCVRAPETALAQAYRARRDGLAFGDVIYEALVCACLELNQVQRAVALFDEGVRERVRHTAVTIEKLIRVFGLLRDDTHVDEFVRWLKARDKGGPEPANEWLIRRALARGRVDAAVDMTRRAVDAKTPIASRTFTEVTSVLLAVDQRRTAQTLLRELAPKLPDVGMLEHAVKMIASAFGPKWGESVDWLHEMRDLGLSMPRAVFSIAISSLKNNVDDSRAFVAQMRDQLGVVAMHYSTALQNCVGDCDATVELFREMLDRDGLMPDSMALNALAKAYVDAGRRRDAVRAVVSTIKTVTNLSDLAFVPLLSKGPPSDKLTRAEFQLDAKGQPSLAWALSFLNEHQPLVERSIELQVRLGELAAEQREYDFILSQVADVEASFPDFTLVYYEAVMKALLAKHQKGTDAVDDSVQRAELAVQLFERAHKLALVRSLFKPWLPVVRRLSAFRDNSFDQPSPPLPYVHSGVLRDVVQSVIERPVINFVPKSTGLWILALRACEKAGLSAKRAAIAADWDRIEPLVLKPAIGRRL